MWKNHEKQRKIMKKKHEKNIKRKKRHPSPSKNPHRRFGSFGWSSSVGICGDAPETPGQLQDGQEMAPWSVENS